MPKQAAKAWHETYKIGELGRAFPVIYFSRARELMQFRDKHGKPGETHRDAILRTAREIAQKRGLAINYTRDHGGITTLAFYKQNRP